MGSDEGAISEGSPLPMATKPGGPRDVTSLRLSLKIPMQMTLMDVRGTYLARLRGIVVYAADRAMSTIAAPYRHNMAAM